MEGQSPATWLAVMAVFGGAGLLRGFTGFGFALMAVPFGALWIAPEALIPVVFLLHIYMGAFELPSAIQLCHRPSLLWLIAGGAIGTPLGIYVLVFLPPKAVYATIGTIVMSSTVLLLAKPSARRLPLSMGAVAGLFAGIFNGMAAMSGPPAIFYFVRGGFPNAQARASLILFFFMTSLYAICVTLYAGLLRKDAIIFSAACFPVMALSAWIGTKLFQKFGGRWYRAIGVVSLAGASAAAFAKMLSL